MDLSPSPLTALQATPSLLTNYLYPLYYFLIPFLLQWSCWGRDRLQRSLACMNGLTSGEDVMSGNDVLPVAIIIASACFLCWVRTAILRIGRKSRPVPSPTASRSPQQAAPLLEQAEQARANAPSTQQAAHLRVVARRDEEAPPILKGRSLKQDI